MGLDLLQIKTFSLLEACGKMAAKGVHVSDAAK